MGKWADRLAAYQEQERLRQDLEGAASLVSTMRSQGFTVRMRGEMIVVSPAPKITDEIRTLVRSLRPAILTVLSIERVRHPGAEK